MSLEAQKAKVREIRYTTAAVITAAGPAIAAALVEGGVSKWIAAFVAIAGILTGTAANATAARKTREQRTGGVFDEPEALDPGTQIAQGAKALQEQRDAIEKQVQAGLEAVKAIAPTVPVLGAQLEDALSRIKF